MIPNTYNTVTEAVSDLQQKGYTIDFNIVEEDNGMAHSDADMVLSAEDFEIDSFFRFDGGSDPGDEMILYAISSTKFNAKGLLLNAYGADANVESATLVSKLDI